MICRKFLTSRAAAAILIGLVRYQTDAQNWCLIVEDFGGFTIGGNPIFDEWPGDLWAQLIDTSEPTSDAGCVMPGGIPPSPQRVLMQLSITNDLANGLSNPNGLVFGLANLVCGPEGPYGDTQGHAFVRLFLIASGSGAAGLVPGVPHYDGPVHPVNTRLIPIPQPIGWYTPPTNDFIPWPLDTPSGHILVCPEPSVLVLLGIGLLTVWLRLR